MVVRAEGILVLPQGLNPAGGYGPFGSLFRTVQVMLVHEGIHSLPEERALPQAPLLRNGGPLDRWHQDPYNQAASGLLGSGD